MATEIKLQALKEGVESVEVNAVRVSAGEVVAKDQTLLEVQADKAALEVPAPVAGRVAEIRVKPGDQVKIGEVYCIIDAGNGAAAAAPAPPAARTAAAPEAPRRDGEKPAPPAQKPPAQKPPVQVRPSAPAPPAPAAPQPQAAAPTPRMPAPAEKVVPAGPATRRLARELGVDLHQVPGTGRQGRVVEEDIKTFVREVVARDGALAQPTGGAEPPPLPKFESFGPVTRENLSRIRKLTARQMTVAWSQVAHVTQHDVSDITELEAFRKAQDGKGPKLTVTAFALKAAAIALKQFPTFNSSLDLANSQLVLKQYCHIGVAVDTEAGLLVPVIRDVDKKSVAMLAQELATSADNARRGKADMGGGSFTITNLGGIGGTGFTPIVNWPEVAILGLSRSRLEPVVKDGQVVPRLMLPLSLSYDHRVIDGAAAARFTRRIADMLANPFEMLLNA